MLDLKFVRQNPDIVRDAIEAKGETTVGVDLDRLLALDEDWRAKLREVEDLKAQRNKVSEEIGERKKQGLDAEEQVAAMREVSDRIKELDEAVRDLNAEIEDLLLRLPNIPAPDVPRGAGESENVEVRHWGEPRRFDFAAEAHWDIGTRLGILDFARAGKITGARFTVFAREGARLVRALINFMLDVHTTENGYSEVLPPFLVNSRSMTGTGNLPKFADDAFHVEKYDFWLVPTAEVPVTNLYAGEVLAEEELPVKHAAYTACFRSEAGSAGRDTRGLIRQHQFDKVELVKFVHPERSEEELAELMGAAESILRKLELPYRVVQMCTGDLGFTAAKKFDLEVWMPSYDRYVEISSCSNFTDFQARRANIRFRPAGGGKLEFVHTLNGSGLAVGRTLAAILENYQEEDGTVRIPKALQPYLGGLERIPAKAGEEE